MILVVNTAEESLQLALVRDGAVLESMAERCQGRMNEVMAPAVAGMLARHGDGLEKAACVRGPGSFTGVRLGMAFCHGLCLARNLPMAGLDYLPLLAASAAESLGRAHSATPGEVHPEIHVVTHSRRGQVYHQSFPHSFGIGSSGAGALAGPVVLSAEAARDLIAGRAGQAPVAVLGTGLRRNPEQFADLGNALRLDLEDPSPQALGDAALSADYCGPPVEALYLRGSDAEENLAAIAAGRGLTEAEALAWMERATR